MYTVSLVAMTIHVFVQIKINQTIHVRQAIRCKCLFEGIKFNQSSKRTHRLQCFKAYKHPKEPCYNLEE